MATAKKLVKPNVLRGTIFDKLAATFGESVLGVYENKLRVEIIDDETGEVVQFSLAPVIHKTLVDEEECDTLVPIADQVAAYEAAKADKDAEALAKKAASAAKKPAKKDKADKPADSVAPIAPIEPIALSEEDKAKLADLSAMLDSSF